MSRILFVVARSLRINTSASIRNKAMIEGLLQNGHEVDLVTAVPDPNHPAYDESLSVEGVRETGIVIHKNIQKLTGLSGKNKLLWSLKSFAYRWMTRHAVYDQFEAMANHTDCVDLSARRYDLIISSSDPKASHLFVLKLLERQHANFSGQWIQIWGDPFLADITRTNRNQKKIREEEARLLRAADRVFYVSALTLAQQQCMYPDCSEKMRYTPIPYATEHVTENRSLRAAQPIELAYCGDYNPSIRNLNPLYGAVQESDNLHLTICGGSSSPLESTDKVQVCGRVSYAKACEVEDRSDILVFVANQSGAQIPGKIYQYAGTNKPILFILDGEDDVLRAQFEQYHRFVFAQNSKESIRRAIDEMVRQDASYAPLRELSKPNVMAAFLQNRL